jgi:hypothetical protein
MSGRLRLIVTQALTGYVLANINCVIHGQPVQGGRPC